MKFNGMKNRSLKFYNMKDRPLAFSVYCGSKEVIPAGTTNVKIAFRQSHLTRLDENGNRVRMNIYIWKGKVYHA